MEGVRRECCEKDVRRGCKEGGCEEKGCEEGGEGLRRV